MLSVSNSISICIYIQYFQIIRFWITPGIIRSCFLLSSMLAVSTSYVLSMWFLCWCWCWCILLNERHPFLYHLNFGHFICVYVCVCVRVCVCLGCVFFLYILFYSAHHRHITLCHSFVDRCHSTNFSSKCSTCVCVCISFGYGIWIAGAAKQTSRIFHSIPFILYFPIFIWKSHAYYINNRK